MLLNYVDVDCPNGSGGGVVNVGCALAQSILSENKHRLAVGTALSVLDDKLSTVGWKVRGHTPDDGNCFFWAASDQLDRVGLQTNTHQQLRKKTVDHLQSMADVSSLHMY